MKKTNHKAVHKEDIYRIPRKPACPVVILDFRVIVHEINRYFEGACTTLGLDPFDPLTLRNPKLKQWLIDSWVIRINRGIDMLDWEPMRVIAVSDSKPYWRSVVCRKIGLEAYKGGRKKDLTGTLELIDRAGRATLAAYGIPYFSQRLFEADDWAGAAYRVKVHGAPGADELTGPVAVMPDRVMFLVTIDGDWQQLVRDDHEILWCNTGPRAWGPRLRGELEVRNHCLAKLKQSLKHPQEMAAAKARVGDAGDNLLIGSPIQLYDLIHRFPKPRYQVERVSSFNDFVAELINPEPNTCKDILDSVTANILKQGLPINLRG